MVRVRYTVSDSLGSKVDIEELVKVRLRSLSVSPLPTAGCDAGCALPAVELTALLVVALVFAFTSLTASCSRL